MTGTQAAFLVVGAVLLLALTSYVVIYNRFVRQRTLIDESWHDVEVELTRRHDLVPNLVAAVRGYADHERDVLERLARAREEADQHVGQAPSRRGPSEEALGGAVRAVLVRAEAYPELKASANFLQLQEQLTDTEDRIAAGRRFYNGNVRAYLTRLGTFPSNLVGSRSGFEPREFFELADPADALAPRVEP